MGKIPLRYIPRGLSRKDRKRQTNMLQRSRRMYKKGKFYTRKKVVSFQSKVSPHVLTAMKMYGVDKIHVGPVLAKKTGCSVAALAAIVKKGEGAYYSSGSRPNQTPTSWGIARLASAITSGKAAAVDYRILESGCKKGSRALRLAKRVRYK